MAVLERVNIQPLRYDTVKEDWVPTGERTLERVPQIFFENGEPWLAANTYALDKLRAVSGNDPKTVVSNMGHLKAYASWLEDKELDWRHFPTRKKDRCLFLFRGFMINQRDEGQISPSTATARMAAIIHFYRWSQVYGWIERQAMWDDRLKLVQFYTSVGFARTMSVVSSELAIPNRKRPEQLLEDGLLPLSDENRNILLRFLKEQGKIEMYLMSMIGFFTGARSETIRSLRLASLENTIDDSLAQGIKRVPVGPGTQVKTKYGVKGNLLFPSDLLDELKSYAYSIRRLTRQARASEDNRTLLFLTERGNAYSETSFTKLISRLREELIASDYLQFKEFKFHQTRATFGTSLMRMAMKSLRDQVSAIVFVRDAMLHKDEATTWKYIKFIETEPVKEALAEEFWGLFSGASEDTQKVISEVVCKDVT